VFKEVSLLDITFCEYWTKLFGSILHADEWIDTLHWDTFHNSTSWCKLLEQWEPLCVLLTVLCLKWRKCCLCWCLFQFAEKQGFQYIKERLSAGGLDAPVGGWC